MLVGMARMAGPVQLLGSGLKATSSGRSGGDWPEEVHHPLDPQGQRVHQACQTQKDTSSILLHLDNSYQGAHGQEGVQVGGAPTLVT